jgi:hypothetical protein
LGALLYVRGVLDAESAFGDYFSGPDMAIYRIALGDKLPDLICLPRGAGLEQALDIVTGYLAANPGTRHQPAYGLARAALLGAWPCQYSAPSK